MQLRLRETLVDVGAFAAFRVFEASGRYWPDDEGWHIEGLPKGATAFVRLAGPFETEEATQCMQDLATWKARLDLGT